MKEFDIQEELKADPKQTLKNKIIYGETRTLHRLHFEGLTGLIQPPFDEGVLADQYRQLKRHLLSELKKPFILITSASEGEGKSTASINLAMSLSLEQDWQVCLVDCSGNDRNCLSQLQVHVQHGLMDYLEDNVESISEYILPTNYPNVKLLPYGKQSARRYELLSSRKMQALLHHLPDVYQNTLFVMDAPELALSETRFLANTVGSVVFVLEQGKTPISKVRNCLKEIDPNKMAGILYNKASIFSLTD